MNNIPKMKIGIVAVSRDCFPESLSVNRRKALVDAYAAKYDAADIYECPVCIVESEIHMVQALEDIKAAGCNDLIAAGAMRALSEAGYRIPEDISVIGFDDMPMCTYITPPLSTVHVPKQYMGEIAVKRLAEIINSTSASHVKIEISTEIIKRKSC